MKKDCSKIAQPHPQKTYEEDFFEKFPNAPRQKDGTPLVCWGRYMAPVDAKMISMKSLVLSAGRN